MATIDTPKLTIVLGPGDDAKVLVDYTITWQDLDKLANVGYWEQVSLWGDDPAKDNRITVMGNFDAYANGEDTLTRHHEFPSSRSQLNEDPLWGDGDELYVKVIMQDKDNQFKPVVAQSDPVSIDS